MKPANGSGAERARYHAASPSPNVPADADAIVVYPRVPLGVAYDGPKVPDPGICPPGALRPDHRQREDQFGGLCRRPPVLSHRLHRVRLVELLPVRASGERDQHGRGLTPSRDGARHEEVVRTLHPLWSVAERTCHPQTSSDPGDPRGSSWRSRPRSNPSRECARSPQRVR